jgi:dihydroorotase
MKTIITSGRIINPATNTDEITDILYENGIIKEIGKNLADKYKKTEAEIINATGMWVVPGLIDMHVHLRDPGYRHKETIASGSKSAAMGGFTTICPMANTNPVCDNEIVVEYITSKAKKEAVVNIVPIGAITKELKGESLSSMGEMAQAGICAVSDDGKTVDNPSLFKSALKYAAMFNLPVLSHCEELRLTGKGQIAAGVHADMMGLKGIPNDSEEVSVARDIILAKSTDAHLHICHISTADALTHLKTAKEAKQKVTAEVCPHHFTLSVEDIPPFDTNYKMSPPLRSKEDVEALKAALKAGLIDVIATDHAPHHKDDKNCEFDDAANGIIGLETAVPLCITELVHTGILLPLTLIEKLTLNPAKILNLYNGKEKLTGTLNIGAPADITIIDPNKEYKIDITKFKSLATNTPFNGRMVKGKVMYTIVSGKAVVKKGEPSW